MTTHFSKGDYIVRDRDKTVGYIESGRILPDTEAWTVRTTQGHIVLLTEEIYAGWSPIDPQTYIEAITNVDV